MHRETRGWGEGREIVDLILFFNKNCIEILKKVCKIVCGSCLTYTNM